MLEVDKSVTAKLNNALCPECESFDYMEYSVRYDDFFCIYCDVWLLKVCPCGDKCEFCIDRPEKPSGEQLELL